jgi:hypothetical protein
MTMGSKLSSKVEDVLEIFVAFVVSSSALLMVSVLSESAVPIEMRVLVLEAGEMGSAGNCSLIMRLRDTSKTARMSTKDNRPVGRPQEEKKNRERSNNLPVGL